MSARELSRRLADSRGQATVELGGMLIWLLLAALFAWQLALVGWADVSAVNAARTASRLASRGASDSYAETHGKQSLTFGLGNHATVQVQNDRAVVHVPIPVLFPGWKPFLSMGITETAYMPYTG